MKRTSKILTLVLSLALICGALIVASSAAAYDVDFYVSTDFEEMTVGTSNTASDGKNPSYDGATIQQGGRAGAVEIAQGNDGNKYLVITQTDKVGTSGPYVWAGIGSRPSASNGKLNKGSTDISNYKLMKLELDFMSPTGKFINGNIDIGARRVTSAGAVDFWNTNATSSIIQFRSDNNGSYIYPNFDSSKKMYVNPYEFTHIELIVENTSTADALGVTTHAYVNGELWFTKAATNVLAVNSTNYYGGIAHASFIEYRINYNTSEDPSQTLAVDNIAWSTVPAGSITTVPEFVDYDANNRPAGLVVATVNGVDYNTLEGAIAAAAEGSTINVLVDKYTPTTVSKDITLDSVGHYLNIVAGSGYVVTDGNSIYDVSPLQNGIVTKKTEKWSSLVGNTASSGNPSGNSYAWTMSGRWGKVEKAENAFGDAYMLYTATDTKGSAAPYFGTGYGGIGTTARPSIAAAGTVEAPVEGDLSYAGSIEFNPYLVFDFDVMAPAAGFTSTTIGLQTRFATGASYVQGKGNDGQLNTDDDTYTWTTALDASLHSAAANAITFDVNTEDGSSWLGMGNNTKTVETGVFNHVTIIYEGVLTETSASYAAHVYFNGEYWYSIDSKDNSSLAYYNGIPHLTWDEIRVQFNDKSADGKQIAFDNMTTRIVTDAYTGNLADVIAAKSESKITNWDGNIYDPAHVNSSATPVAEVNGQKYFDLEKAIVSASNGGKTVTLLASYEAEEPIVVSNLVTINTNGFTANLVAGEGYNLNATATGYVSVALEKTFQYVADGITKYGYEGATLGDVFAAADEGTTIKFLKDYTSDAVVNVNKNITFDLNGKTYNATTNGLKDNFGAFKASTTAGFTITSSVPGAKIFIASINGTQAKGDPFITTTVDNAVINFKGNDADGNTTLRFYGPTIVQAWSNNGVVLNIDGGEYYRTASDNQGLVQLQGSLDFDAKNALFYDPSACIFFFNGRSAPASETYNSFATVDNCVLIGAVATNSFKELEFIITNSYIAGNIKPTGTYSGETVGEVILGDGNYISGDISSNVVCEDGMSVHTVNLPYTKTLNYNTYTVNDGVFADSSFEISTYEKNYTMTKYISDVAPTPITVNWVTKDDKVLGTSQAYPGTRAAVPADLELPVLGTLVEGWFDYTYGDWETSLDIPVDATGEYNIVAKEANYKPVLSVAWRFNIRSQTHNQICFYIPTPHSGVEFVAADIGGTARTPANSGKINGQDYQMMTVWPGVITSARKAWTASVTVNYFGQEYTSTTSVDMAQYVETILEDDYSIAGKKYAVNNANYLIKCVDLRGTTDTAITTKLREIVANNTSRIITIPESELAAPDTSAISKYVSGVQMTINDSTPMVRFNLTDAAAAATVTVLKLNTKYTVANDKSYIQTDGGVAISTINKVMITVTDNGTTTTFTYSLANYFSALNGVEGYEKQAAVVEALYGYVKADANYVM